MSPAAVIAGKDWREFLRDRRLLLTALLVGLLAVAAVVSAAAQVSAYEADRRATESRDRATWEGQGARNPHSVAHFSSWAMRPLTAGALLDPGVTPYAGTAVWMEAHSWNPPKNRPVEDEVTSVDLGRFSIAWLLQTVAPLLLFVIAAGKAARRAQRDPAPARRRASGCNGGAAPAPRPRASRPKRGGGALATRCGPASRLLVGDRITGEQLSGER